MKNVLTQARDAMRKKVGRKNVLKWEKEARELTKKLRRETRISEESA